MHASYRKGSYSLLSYLGVCLSVVSSCRQVIMDAADRYDSCAGGGDLLVVITGDETPTEG